jgi:phosphohistidine swiveling domain-containing protein
MACNCIDCQKAENRVELFDVNSIDKAPEIYGGKAVGLMCLMNVGLTVPRAWVLPCALSLTRPPVTLDHLSKIKRYYGYYKGSVDRVRFAVRSGAPISMPGLMETKLRVPYGELIEAIVAVWDSYNTPHAKEYRKVHSIPDDIGTAVIIQEMPTDIKYSGVCFTDDTNGDQEEPDFNPTIEYVEGLGDALVGGTVTPKRASVSSRLYRDVAYCARIIHNNFGPSDIEWVQDEENNLFFVQRRDLKYAVKSETPIDTDGREVLLRGKAVGAPVGVVCTIQSAGKHKQGNAVFLKCFMPEHYKEMMEAGAILTSVGGSTCHAAIIANEAGIPAVSSIPEAAIKTLLGKTVYVDGKNGAILSLKPGEAPTSTTQQTTVNVVDDWYLLPDVKIARSGAELNVSLLMYRFYYTIAEHREGKIDSARKNDVIGEIAKIISTYFYMATICESRWLWCKAQPSLDRRKVYSGLARLGLRFPKDYTLKDRGKMATTIPTPKTLEEATQIMGWIKDGFQKVAWNSSFGGPAWGRIAELLHNYLSRAMPPTLFVDKAFNMEHNGGNAFGKFGWMPCNSGAVQEQLNKRQSGTITGLRNVLVNQGIHSSSTVDQYATVKYILGSNIRGNSNELKIAA